MCVGVCILWGSFFWEKKKVLLSKPSAFGEEYGHTFSVCVCVVSICASLLEKVQFWEACVCVCAWV